MNDEIKKIVLGAPIVKPPETQVSHYKFTSGEPAKKEDSFEFNLDAKERFFVVDNFYKDPHAVREFALKQEFIQGGIGRGFIGSRTAKQYLFPGLKERFEAVMGDKITKWESHGMNGRFQFCIAGEPLVYHCDDQTRAAMLFLTPDAPFESGTTFFAHRKTRIRESADPNILTQVFNTGTHLDRTPYQPVDIIGNVFNRLVIFDAHLIHSASEYFGSNINNGRLFQIFFFD